MWLEGGDELAPPAYAEKEIDAPTEQEQVEESTESEVQA